MKKLFDMATARIREFVSQRDALALAIRTPSHESAYILKILQGEDESDMANMYWCFAEDFQGPAPYVEAIVAAFGRKLEAVREMQEKEGEAPWKPLPPGIADSGAGAAPVERLRALMVFSRTLLPKLEGHAVVWGFLPMKIGRPEEYAPFFEALLEHEMPHPWCHHLRVVVRDEPSLRLLRGLPSKVGRTREYHPDFSVAAMEKSLEEESADEGAPLPERLQNAFILANMDFSHGRYAAALDKYRVLLKYYVATKNPVFTALVLNGMGETYSRMEKPKEAKAHFESALTPAIESQSHPVLLNISLNLGNLHLKHKLWAEAEIYYDSAATLAQALLIPQTRIQSLDNRGLCQYQQGRPKDALDSWDAALALAKGMEEKDLQKQVLLHKQMLFRETGHPEHEKAVARDLQGIG